MSSLKLLISATILLIFPHNSHALQLSTKLQATSTSPLTHETSKTIEVAIQKNREYGKKVFEELSTIKTSVQAAIWLTTWTTYCDTAKDLTYENIAFTVKQAQKNQFVMDGVKLDWQLVEFSKKSMEKEAEVLHKYNLLEGRRQFDLVIEKMETDKVQKDYDSAMAELRSAKKTLKALRSHEPTTAALIAKLESQNKANEVALRQMTQRAEIEKEVKNTFIAKSVVEDLLTIEHFRKANSESVYLHSDKSALILREKQNDGKHCKNRNEPKPILLQQIEHLNELISQNADVVEEFRTPLRNVAIEFGSHGENNDLKPDTIQVQADLLAELLVREKTASEKLTELLEELDEISDQPDEYLRERGYHKTARIGEIYFEISDVVKKNLRELGESGKFKEVFAQLALKGDNIFVDLVDPKTVEEFKILAQMKSSFDTISEILSVYNSHWRPANVIDFFTGTNRAEQGNMRPDAIADSDVDLESGNGHMLPTTSYREAAMQFARGQFGDFQIQGQPQTAREALMQLAKNMSQLGDVQRHEEIGINAQLIADLISKDMDVLDRDLVDVKNMSIADLNSASSYSSAMSVRNAIALFVEENRSNGAVVEALARYADEVLV